MKALDYTVETTKPFDEAVEAVEQSSKQRGFRVLHTHDVAAALAEKGFKREPLKIIEICNARYAHQVLKRDIRLALLLPCPISVYSQGGKTFISTLLPSAMVTFFPETGIEGIAAEVEEAVLDIVEAASHPRGKP